MTETGTVIERRASGDVLVEVSRTAACDGCHARGACAMTFLSRKMRFVVEDPIGVSVGDCVTLDLDDRGFLGACLIVYGIPLATMLGAVIVGAAFLQDGAHDGLLAGMAFAGLGLGVGAVALIERRLRSRTGGAGRFKVKLTGKAGD